MTVEAHAFSQGTDITAAVGPFTFSANNQTVVNLVPIDNILYSPITGIPYSLATNQATATALFPGITQIYASAGGVTSSSFQQPQYQNAQGTTSPVLDFFETCPIQSVALELGSGSQLSGQTTFVTAKGTTETVTAVLTDIMGYTSLPNTNGGIVLNKIPLTWSSSRPGVLASSTGCLETCALATPLPGSGSVTASCTPPTCNIGFPYVPSVSRDTRGPEFLHAVLRHQLPAAYPCPGLCRDGDLRLDHRFHHPGVRSRHQHRMRV